MKSALICVTYGDNWAKLALTLNSIYANTDEPFHLFLIDNASRGQTLSLYGMENLPGTTLVRNPTNIWWGGGINQGLRLALHDDFEYIFFLNDDIEVPRGWLGRFTKILSAQPEIGAVGPLNSSVRDWQGYDKVRRNYRQLNLRPLDDIDRLDLEAMDAAVQTQGKSWCYIKGMLAFFCTGFRRQAVEKAGYLDPDFFPLMCGDDNAYCMEIEKAGYQLALALNLYVLHHAGCSVNAIDDDTRKKQKATAAFLLQQKYPDYYGPMLSHVDWENVLRF